MTSHSSVTSTTFQYISQHRFLLLQNVRKTNLGCTELVFTFIQYLCDITVRAKHTVRWMVLHSDDFHFHLGSLLTGEPLPCSHHIYVCRLWWAEHNSDSRCLNALRIDLREKELRIYSVGGSTQGQRSKKRDQGQKSATTQNNTTLTWFISRVFQVPVNCECVFVSGTLVIFSLQCWSTRVWRHLSGLRATDHVTGPQ